jgi:hypothetical protein
VARRRLGNGCVIGTDAMEGFVELEPTESFERQGRSVGTDGGLREARPLNWYASVTNIKNTLTIHGLGNKSRLRYLMVTVFSPPCVEGTIA